jgi:ATP-dependent exoDNAse (exonuclease V) beta subunit
MIDDLKKLKVFDRITFYDDKHSYKIDGQPSAKVSVTGLVNTVKEPFDEEKWAGIKAKEHGITPEEMKLLWKKNNQMATYQGSTLHNYIDNFYQNKVKPYNRNLAEAILGQTLHEMMYKNLKVLVKHFMNFYNDTKDYVLPIKNEFVVGDLNDTRICGMLDMLIYNTQTEKYEIFDFKTNKKFTEASEYNKKLLSPVEHLDETEYNIYSLQLSLYKLFIEKYTGLEINKLKIVWFSINNDNYKVIELKYLPKECEALMKKFLTENTLD